MRRGSRDPRGAARGGGGSGEGEGELAVVKGENGG